MRTTRVRSKVERSRACAPLTKTPVWDSGFFTHALFVPKNLNVMGFSGSVNGTTKNPGFLDFGFCQCKWAFCSYWLGPLCLHVGTWGLFHSFGLICVVHLNFMVQCRPIFSCKPNSLCTCMTLYLWIFIELEIFVLQRKDVLKNSWFYTNTCLWLKGLYF